MSSLSTTLLKKQGVQIRPLRPISSAYRALLQTLARLFGQFLETVRKGCAGSCFAALAHMRKTYPTDLSDAEWECIEPHPTTPRAAGSLLGSAYQFKRTGAGRSSSGSFYMRVSEK